MDAAAHKVSEDPPSVHILLALLPWATTNIQRNDLAMDMTPEQRPAHMGPDPL